MFGAAQSRPEGPSLGGCSAPHIVPGRTAYRTSIAASGGSERPRGRVRPSSFHGDKASPTPQRCRPLRLASWPREARGSAARRQVALERDRPHSRRHRHAKGNRSRKPHCDDPPACVRCVLSGGLAPPQATNPHREMKSHRHSHRKGREAGVESRPHDSASSVVRSGAGRASRAVPRSIEANH